MPLGAPPSISASQDSQTALTMGNRELGAKGDTGQSNPGTNRAVAGHSVPRRIILRKRGADKVSRNSVAKVTEVCAQPGISLLHQQQRVARDCKPAAAQ